MSDCSTCSIDLITEESTETYCGGDVPSLAFVRDSSFQMDITNDGSCNFFMVYRAVNCNNNSSMKLQGFSVYLKCQKVNHIYGRL